MDVSNINLKKYDKDCKYIKRWLPHLNEIKNKDLYYWDEKIANKYGNIHPAPMFNASERFGEWIDFCFQLAKFY